jgi:hypothetical protein
MTATEDCNQTELEAGNEEMGEPGSGNGRKVVMNEEMPVPSGSLVVDDLASDLTMLSSQIREAGRGEGALPNPWHIEDWLVRYSQYYADLRNKA